MNFFSVPRSRGAYGRRSGRNGFTSVLHGLLWAGALLLAASPGALAQFPTFQGFVGANGASVGIPGVLVMWTWAPGQGITGPTYSTTTDANGNYSGTLPASGATYIWRFTYTKPNHTFQGLDLGYVDLTMNGAVGASMIRPGSSRATKTPIRSVRGVFSSGPRAPARRATWTG